MRKEQNFAKLFRHSRFAQFDASIPRIYEASPVFPSAVKGHCRTDRRPAFFGFKRDLHPTHYGRPLKYVQMEALDGAYGQCTLHNAEERMRRQRVISELQRLLGTGHCNFTNRPMLHAEGVRIPGRVLNRLESGGYAIGVGGVVADLPITEIPPTVHFTQDDVGNRRTFYFYVKSAAFDAAGTPRIVLSLRPTQ